MSPIMRNLFPFFLLLIGFISLQRHELNAQTGIPRILSIQGMLTSSFGSKPITGKQLFRVGIYESLLGGLPLHEQIDTVLVGESGLYQFSLGGMKGLPRTVKFDNPYFIDISVNGEKQNMRIPLQSAAYAFMAGAVENNVIGVEQLDPTLRDKLFPDQKDIAEKTLANYVSGLRSVIAGGDGNRTSANYASILGGFTNSVNGSYGTIGGGQNNLSQGAWSFVGGGQNNLSQGAWSFVGSGQNNLSQGAWSFVGGGQNNRAQGNSSVVTGGGDNIATSSASYGTVSGGQGHQLGANYGTISGGQTNIIGTAQGGTIGGGQNNKSMQEFATVGGGKNNIADASGATISGGLYNTASGKNSAILGGNSNTANGQNSGIGFGSSNTASNMYSTVSGGFQNQALQMFSTVSGGSTNNSLAVGAFIGGGRNNSSTNSADYASILGGTTNSVSGTFATIGGGQKNNASGSGATISGGQSNTASGQHSSVLGGSSNTANGMNAGVGFGSFNTASNVNSTVSGGLQNKALQLFSTVSGGSTNSSLAEGTFIGGGRNNTAENTAIYSTISGGLANSILAPRSTVGGGSGNLVSANAHAVVIAGGDTNTITHTGTSTSYNSIINGGNRNIITNSNASIIGGGRLNSISGSSNFSNINGGESNSISTAQYAMIAGGSGNTVSASYGMAAGQSNSVSAINGVALGVSNSVNGVNGVAIGSSNTATANGIALGSSNSVNGVNGVAMGSSNTVTANGIALGSSNSVNGINGMAIGNSATAESNQLYSKFSAGHVFEGQGTAIGNYVAQFYNPTPGGSGIEIKIANPIPSKSNHFVTFENASGGRVGKISGQTLAEMYASSSYKEEKRKLEKDRALKIEKSVTSGLILAVKTNKAIQKGIEVAGGAAEIASAAASTAATLGAGSGWTVNTVIEMAFKIAQAIPEVTEATIAGYQEGQAIADAVLAKEKIQHWIQNQDEQIGVTYESGSADYAEWLPKQEIKIDFTESSIVGIHKGKIRYETEGAEQLMVVSSRPMILGNMPADGKEHEFEAVAFMGQVPVSILGAVAKGDFILPSGGNHGLGIAVHPEDMRNEDFGNIVGIAWSDAPDTFAINKVNVAVGLQTTTLANQISKQSKEIAELKKAVRMINESLIAMSNNQTKTASISVNQDKTFYLVNDQSIIDSKPSLNGETKIPVHAMHKECLLKFDTMISSNDIPTSQINNTMQNALRNDPILKELYLYSMIQRLRN